MADRVGQQLGNYRLMRLLGRGAFADVYLGEHVYLKRLAALKVLRNTLKEEEEEQFLAEARILARLTHPYIVRIHDFAVEQGTPFFVMDYAPQGTLRGRHPRGFCVSLEMTVSYVKQLAAALQYAHNHKVIHRDVKPENILIGSPQHILLSDFGISLLAASPRQMMTQEMVGTLYYMAPEQFCGNPCFASDQYALGVIVYEWLCGVRPFEGAAVLQHLRQREPVLPPRLREKDPSLPQAVEDVVLKALALDPQERFVSVQMFASALQRASQASAGAQHGETEWTVLWDPLSPSLALAPRRVFLSAPHADAAFVARLTNDLEMRDITVEHEQAESVPQPPSQEEALRQAIRAAQILLVVASPQTLSSRRVKDQLRIAEIYQRPVVYVCAEDEFRAEALPLKEEKALVLDARGSCYEQALDEIVTRLEQERMGSPFLELSPQEETDVDWELRNPYKGLRAFTQDDAADFFGRDTLIGELTGRVKEVLKEQRSGLAAARLLTVIGPSGSGKSSVVMAGLLPRLQKGVLQGSEQWVYLQPIVPGTRPVEALALALAPRLPGRSWQSICEELQDDSAQGLHRLASRLVTAPKQHVVLLINQFEELFTLTTSEEERAHFIDLLITAAIEPQGPVLLILTLRADFYDRPLSYPELGRLIQRHQLVVLPMEMNELRAAIQQPAALPDVQLSFEGNLVGDLLYEMQGQPGALPLLQFTLEQLFERRKDHLLPLRAYAEIGGVKGALTKQAESTYASLPSEAHRQFARVLFLRLIDPGLTPQETTRRRAALAELALPDPEQTALLRSVADAFIAARLLTTNEMGGNATIEVSHEALIREWPLLATWLREAREDISLQQTLSADAAEWLRRGKPVDRLYRGSQLAEAQAWAERNVASRDEVAFLQASVDEGERQAAEAKAKQEKVKALQQSVARRQRYVLSMTLVTSLVLVVALIIGLLYRALLVANQELQRSLPVSVTNLNDHGPGSLREAIAKAPAGSGITFAKFLHGTIKLTSGELKITKNLAISGPGVSALTISGEHKSRVFNLTGNAAVSISNLAIKNGRASSAADRNDETGAGGGGIYNTITSSLTLTNTLITGNQARVGGGIDNNGYITITDSVISDNAASQDGGGVYNLMSGRLFNSTFSHNTASRTGGGIWNGGWFVLDTSTISGNRALTGGGMINTLPAEYGDTVYVLYSTFYGNQATSGGGIAGSSGTLTGLHNSLIAGNHASRAPDALGPFKLRGSDLIQDSAGATFSLDPGPYTKFSHLIVGKPADVGPLQRNGGLTMTHALLPGSPAIDQIPPGNTCGGVGYPPTDQRGVGRPQGTGCDLGAYEYVPPVVPSSHASR